MFETVEDRLRDLGRRLARRRKGLGLTQEQAAKRSGVSYRTWRRMETQGRASIEDLVRAATALRCEQDLKDLFPEPAAGTMDELLERQRKQGGKRSQW